MNNLRICIDARLDSQVGGVQQVVIGLASGFSNLNDGNEEYFFLANKGHDEWLQPYISGRCQIIHGSGATYIPKKLSILKKMPGSKLILKSLKYATPFRLVQLPHSDGTIEKLKINVIHFTSQSGFLTSIPSIYNPHDLQHIHYPEYFDKKVILQREHNYRLLCQQAELIGVTSTWVKDDFINNYQLEDKKIIVIPWAPVLPSSVLPSTKDLTAVRNKYNLPSKYILYPAQTWPHKNHLKLFEALSILNHHYNLKVFLVLTGHVNEFYEVLLNKINCLGIGGQVSFLGLVTLADLHCIYRLSRALVVPSYFEAASFPLWEAFSIKVPAAVSNVTSLPIQAKNAALLFDPNDSFKIAETIFNLWTNDSLCDILTTRGYENVSRFSWDRTVRMYRACYKMLGNIALTEHEQKLLNEPPFL